MDGSILERLQDHERWLMRRVRARAAEYGYTPFTSTLEEAWRISIEGLSCALRDAWTRDPRPRRPRGEPGLGGCEEAFAVLEARRHRERGVPLGMFLGLFKHYRDTYLELLAVRAPDQPEAAAFAAAFFDQVEVAFCGEWGRLSGDAGLRDADRRLAGEKSRTLTIFESLPGPALYVGPDGTLENMNCAAGELLLGERNPGAGYYGEVLGDQFSWLTGVVGELMASAPGKVVREVDARTARGLRRVRISGSRVLDVSGTCAGALLLLEDATERAALEERVQVLQRLALTPELARDLAHELNNPLACVVANLELLETDQQSILERMTPAERAECQEALAGAREGAERIRLLVEDLERILREQRMSGVAGTPH
ncbi:MAG: PAS domain-containing protein [Deltaproteobacteria bacterium]|nr:PAS domain-containing protein [Deltaproteobacteria bacterium]